MDVLMKQLHTQAQENWYRVSTHLHLLTKVHKVVMKMWHVLYSWETRVSTMLPFKS